MTLKDRHNAARLSSPYCPCCKDVKLDDAGDGLWTCAGCRGELGREPCYTVCTPIEAHGSPDGEHYHFTTRQGIRATPTVNA